MELSQLAQEFLTRLQSNIVFLWVLAGVGIAGIATFAGFYSGFLNSSVEILRKWYRLFSILIAALSFLVAMDYFCELDRWRGMLIGLIPSLALVYLVFILVKWACFALMDIGMPMGQRARHKLMGCFKSL